MASSRQGSQFFEFGPFRVDTENGLLLRNGAPVRLTPKAFEMLLVLVERRGRVVGKDELMQRLWPDTFVEEGTLVQNIFTLRKALGDDRSEHSYIRTVPRRGYCFTGDVTELGGDELILHEHLISDVVIEEEIVDGKRATPASGLARDGSRTGKYRL